MFVLLFFLMAQFWLVVVVSAVKRRYQRHLVIDWVTATQFWLVVVVVVVGGVVGWCDRRLRTKRWLWQRMKKWNRTESNRNGNETQRDWAGRGRWSPATWWNTFGWRRTRRSPGCASAGPAASSATSRPGSRGKPPVFCHITDFFLQFYPNWRGFTGFYRVLPSFTEFYRVLPSFTEFYLQ